MGITTFTGPIKAGDVLNTTGTTPGTLQNVGYCVMVQTANITQAGTATASANTICIPANSHIIQIQVLADAAWDGASSNISIGWSSSANQLVSAQAVNTVGRFFLTPGTDVTRVLNWTDTGNTDKQIWVLSANTGNGTGELVIQYIQANNIIP
jgi:hypothetical protein